jgi:hypothetical protein
MMFLNSIALTFVSWTLVHSSCPRPPFVGDQTSAMSPTQMMKRAARRAGGVPSPTEVYASPNVQRIQRVFPESLYTYMFPRANLGKGPGAGNGPYSYFNFLKAAAMWPGFCSEAASTVDLDVMCKKELASMFAHFSQEVGEHDAGSPIPMWRQGLYWYTEMGCSDNPSQSGCEYRGGTCDTSTWMGQIWQCPAGVKYFGRGAKQLSYNFNYGPFSYALFGDVNVLLKDPSLVVANDDVNGWMAFASAFWFYMTPQSPKPSMHDAVVGFWTPSSGDISGKRVPGFGVLIMIINGGIECGGSKEIAQAQNRIDYYKGFLQGFGLPAEDPATMGCKNMQQFDSSSSAFKPSYWEESWSTQSCGVSCQLVSYQTGFSIFDDPTQADIPYNKCIQYYYGAVTTSAPTVSPPSTAVPGTTVSPGDVNACKSCSTCVAVPGNSQSADDSQCAPCGSGTLQTWWPCNVAGLCRCSSSTLAPTTKAPVTSGPTTTSKAPDSTSARVTTTEPPVTVTTTASATPVINACTKCATCIAVPGNTQAATDSHCSPCGSGTLQTWWPCNVSGLCQCASGPLTTSKPTTSSLRISTTASAATSVNRCATCGQCEAIPGNTAGAIDSHCVPCGSGTLQTWWPCNVNNICRCKAV